MAGDELPARGNLGPESTAPSSPGPGGEALAGTSAGSGTTMEGIGTNAAAGAEDAGTEAGTGTGSTGPGTTAGAGPAGTQAGAEEGAVGSGYGGPVTPGGPTGEPIANQQTRSTTLDGSVGRDATGSEPQRAGPARGQGELEDDPVTESSMESFPASDPPAY